MKRIAILFILSAVFFSGCSSTKWVRTTVAKEYDFVVTLEQRQEQGKDVRQEYAQPFEISLADLETLLGDLVFTEKIGLGTTVQQTPVFQPVEIERLSPVLAETLAKADANQRIRFISFNIGKNLIFSVPQKTEGVLFVESDGRLNIAFNYINASRQPNETTAIYAAYSKVNPLKIETSDTPIPLTAPYAEFHNFENGVQAPMWVVADLKKLRGEVLMAPDPVVKGMEEAIPATVPKSETMGTPVEKMAPAQTDAERLKEDIKGDLRFLKELWGEGLISEKEYTAKKMELLNKID